MAEKDYWWRQEHSSLSLEKWFNRMEEHAPQDLAIQYEQLAEPQGVMGVGDTPSSVTHVAGVPLGMADQGIPPSNKFLYKATVISNSDVPALLGLQSMLSSICIMDLRPGKMHIYTMKDPAAMEIKYVAEKSGEVGRLKWREQSLGTI